MGKLQGIKQPIGTTAGNPITDKSGTTSWLFTGKFCQDKGFRKDCCCMRCQEMCRSWVFSPSVLVLVGTPILGEAYIIELTYVTSRPEERNDTLYIYILYILTYIHIPMYRHVSVS